LTEYKNRAVLNATQLDDRHLINKREQLCLQLIALKFIYLFNDSISSLDYKASNGRMIVENSKLEMVWKDALASTDSGNHEKTSVMIASLRAKI
jgi:hypothetical protein